MQVPRKNSVYATMEAWDTTIHGESVPMRDRDS